MLLFITELSMLDTLIIEFKTSIQQYPKLHMPFLKTLVGNLFFKIY